MAGKGITVSEANTLVGELVYHFQQHLADYTGIRVAEIIKAGSLGHGTAVPGSFDLDLVIYSRDVNAETAAQYGYGEWLEKLKRFLSSTLDGYQLQRTTAFSVQFKYNGMIDVDLLVSPYWSSKEEFYRFLKRLRPETRFDFSVCAAKWQVQFFQHQDEQVKEFIRRAKAWRNKQWPKSSGGSGRPKSYFISVLVLRAHERAIMAVSPKSVAERTTQELKSIVKNHRTLDIYWEVNYTRQANKEILPSRPRIIDPANPSNDLYKTGIVPVYGPNERAHDYEPGGGDWRKLVALIDTVDLTKTTQEISTS